MSLRILNDLEQGTEAWHDARRGIVTASVVGRLVTPSTIKPAQNPEARSIVAQLVAERITDYTDPTYQSDDMAMGHEVEPMAAEVYSKHYGVQVESCGLMIRDDWGYEIGFSPDGLVDEDGLIETKSRRQKKHLQTILADAVPAENMAQIQCGLLVSGREWCDYISYCGGMPMWVKRVEPDPRWQAAIVEAVELFELAAAVMRATYDEATQGLAETERPIDLYLAELKL